VELSMKFEPAQTPVNRLAANIYRATSRMRKLLADLAAGNCANTSTPKICKIRDAIVVASKAAISVAEKQGVQILTDVPGDLDVPLEVSHIEGVFFNLIINALEAMPHGGRIRIGARRADNYVLIAIEDTGPGIPRGIRDRLFERLATAGKEQRLGLGLALSRQTVLDYGGDMWTEPAAGARFVIRLPLTKVSKVASNATC
jgi:signal transduction histidine kinase